MTLKFKSAPTLTYRLWIAGDYATAVQVVREFCRGEGACFSVMPCAYVYTGGMEDGVCVTGINYPLFPADEAKIYNQVGRLAEKLRHRLCQLSYTIEGPRETRWVSHRQEDCFPARKQKEAGDG